MKGEVVIRKQKIRISASSEKLAFECRQTLDNSLHIDLVKMFERLFYQGTQSDNYVIIDSIKVDLGVLSLTDFKIHFFELIEEKLINELKKLFESVSDTHDLKEAQESESPVHPDTVFLTTGTKQIRAALLFFLEKGSFPWWYGKKIGKNPSELLIDFNSHEQKEFFNDLIAKTRILPEVALEKIIKRLFIHLNQSSYETCLTAITHLILDESDKSNIQILIDQKNNLSNLFKISIKDFYEQLVVFLLITNDLNDFIKKFLYFLIQRFSLSSNGLQERFKESNNSELIMLNHLSYHEKIEVSREYPVLQTDKMRPKFPENDFELYVSNSGLVILHPFLQGLFNGLSLLNEENQFKSEDAKIKATVLLYYLQSGNEDYREWEMPLNKILCGMQTNEVIPDNVFLTNDEKQECDLLLQSVVEYWNALKGASIEALQTTFIIREGKITFKENHWLIQVERTGVDILLDRLPWGIGTIKLPWLKEIIYTEW